jgi:hypothetical protein
MTDRRPAPKLTSDLDHWEVTLRTGEVLTVRAHAFGESGEDYVFVALMKGEPNFEYELLRMPAVTVAEVEGGWQSPRSEKSHPES